MHQGGNLKMQKVCLHNCRRAWLYMDERAERQKRQENSHKCIEIQYIIRFFRA